LLILISMGWLFFICLGGFVLLLFANRMRGSKNGS